MLIDPYRAIFPLTVQSTRRTLCLMIYTL